MAHSGIRINAHGRDFPLVLEITELENSKSSITLGTMFNKGLQRGIISGRTISDIDSSPTEIIAAFRQALDELETEWTLPPAMSPG